MALDTFEQQAFDTPKFDISGKISSLHKGFESAISSVNGAFLNPETSKMDASAANWLGLENVDLLCPLRTNVFETVKNMYEGVSTGLEGEKTLGLKEISGWKVNKDYYEANNKQHAGYAAEVIGTAKENLMARLNGTGKTTYRVDDLTDDQRNQIREQYGDDFAKKNDPYVDKIRISSDGTMERIQTKFVGSDASECLSKLQSSKFDKYFNDGKVDKLEIASDQYDEMKTKLIPEAREKLKQQYDAVMAKGETDIAEKKLSALNRLDKIDSMIEKSTVSSDEAITAVLHPERYTKRITARENIIFSNKAGLDSGLEAAALTAAVSTVDNVTKVMSGEVSAQEAFADVAKDTGVAGAIGYGTAFVSTSIAEGMKNSSHVLLKSMGKAGIPAAVISFGVESYETVSDYAQGKIGTDEFVYEMGENAADVAGGAAGGALAGAALGSIVPGAGTVVGFAAGMAGGMVGTAVAAEAYKTAVAVGSGGAEVLADKAEALAKSTVEIAEKNIPDMAGKVRGAFNDFAKTNALPFQI